MSVNSKPFSTNFDRQMEALEVNETLVFDNKKVQEVLDTYKDYLERVGEVLEYQRERYYKLFV